MSEIDRELFDDEEFRIQISSPRLMTEMIDIFPEETTKYLENARKALDEEDAEGLHHAAHTLKGTVGNYLGNRAFAAAAALDRCARDRKFDEAREALAVCEKEVRDLGEALEKFRAEESGTD